jgi:HEAT repeat protein
MRSDAVRWPCWTWTVVALVAVTPPAVRAAAEEAAASDEDTVQSAGLTGDGAALVAFFQGRARTAAEPKRLDDLARQLADDSSGSRRQAAAELVALGPLAVPVLRRAATDSDAPEAAALAKRCLSWLDGPASARLAAAAARLLAQRRPPGAAQALLAYLPFADDADVARAVGDALAAVAAPQGKPDPALVDGLADPLPARRAAACAALCKAAPPQRTPEVRKLLEDPSPTVKLRAALALAEAGEASAVPVLIGLLADLPAEQRAPAEEFLRKLAGEWAPAADFRGEDEIARATRRDAWAAWWRNADGPALLAALRKRTLTAEGRARVASLIRRLGDEDFAARERASADLAALGTLALPQLREAVSDKDPEVARRAKACVGRIEREPAHRLPAAAVRLVALRKPAGAAEALLAYLPFAEEESVATEVRTALTALALREDKPEPALVAALSDTRGVVRSAAAEALAKGGGEGARPAVRKLLADADPQVRLRVGLALAVAGERSAVPVLIDLLAVLPAEQAGAAEDALYQLAADKPPEMPSADEKDERKKRRDTWAAWWKTNGDKTDLARLRSVTPWLGFTLLCEGNNNRVTELGRDGKVRWTIQGVMFPVDAVVLPGNRVLVAECHGGRVTERDLKGNILWQKAGLTGSPVNVQRLPNGNTFIATTNQLVEVDRTGKELYSIINLNGHGAATAAYKGRDGHIVCLSQNGQCLRMDTTGKVLKSFPSGRGPGWTSGLDLLPNGHILISQPDHNKVSEYDAEGKLLHEFQAPQVTTATGLPNGHVLVASTNTNRAFELDRKGKVVWEHTGGTFFRARRR